MATRNPLRLALGFMRGLLRAGVVLLAVVGVLLGVYLADVLASEQLRPTVRPRAFVASGSPPCGQASLVLAVASGAGRQTSYEMGPLLTGLAHEYDACVVVLDYGSVMDTRGNVDALLGAALAGRQPGHAPLPVVLLGNSTGGIEVQREANILFARHAHQVRVVSVVADSTPASAADLRVPVTRDLAAHCTVPLGHFLGQNIVRLWHTYEEVSRRGEDLRDTEVLSRIQSNTDHMQARLTLSQLCMIEEGYPWINVATPAAGIPHVYVRPAGVDADEVVDSDRAVASIDEALGGGLEVVAVPGGLHGSAYLMWPTYEPVYRSIINRAWLTARSSPGRAADGGAGAAGPPRRAHPA